MQIAADKLIGDFQDYAAVTVTITRGSSITIEDVTATVGRTPYDIIDGDAMISMETRDYFIEKTDYVNGSTQLYPQQGDRITEDDGRIYEVSCPKGDNVYEALGPDGGIFKIHTVGKKS